MIEGIVFAMLLMGSILSIEIVFLLIYHRYTEMKDRKYWQNRIDKMIKKYEYKRLRDRVLR